MISRIPETVRIDLNGSEVADFLQWLNCGWSEVPQDSPVRVLPNWFYDLLAACTDKHPPFYNRPLRGGQPET